MALDKGLVNARECLLALTHHTILNAHQKHGSRKLARVKTSERVDMR
jgi:hypothetical protein